MNHIHNPAHEEKRGLSFVLAALMHVVLFGALLLSVQWKTQKPTPVVVELWGGPPPAAPAEVPPQPVVKNKPVKVEPPKPEVVPEKVDIATEKVKTTPAPTAKPTATPKVTPKPTPLPTATPKATAAPKATPVSKPTAAPVSKATAAPKAKVPPKQSELEAALSLDNVVASNNKSDAKAAAGGKPGGNGNNPKAVGNGGPGKGSGNNAAGLESYKGKLIQLIKSRAVYQEGKSANPTAEFKVVVLPDGSILEDQLEQLGYTGDPAYAAAMKRAILNLGRFPSLPNGQTFSGEYRTWNIKFRLKEGYAEP
ncbi:TonB C-terminal domain-containing protein [Chitinibacter bivalviorum]|uniref:TonB C-terminal domain-containing protein n=1 Tax=Chitinibacter bivalviorum TaxID=2739434 RepID=A0A7H9BL66_9NEIS|nr:TonB C-terminal domain-containing protein [Chitinibacter bivalviorum]QLG89086.1 TonB C-terminal domain-containing protein [Chitinibacter bivalviorum]